MSSNIRFVVATYTDAFNNVVTAVGQVLEDSGNTLKLLQKQIVNPNGQVTTSTYYTIDKSTAYGLTVTNLS